MVHILLTFDYELFFNEAYCSEKEILIDSTYVIKEGLDKEGVKGTFFIDAPCVERYEHYGLYDFPQMVKKQLNELLDSKHDVQLHLHPSWYSAVYDGKKWSFRQEDYSLDKHSNPSELIIKAKGTLDSLVGGNHNYRCIAFRAGGFCLAPEKEVLTTLYSLGIRIDSSVCCGVKMDSIAQSFDWTGVPDTIQWSFLPDTGVKVKSINQNECMYEIPVGTYPKVPGKWVLTHAYPKLNYPEPKGKTSPVESKYRKTAISRLSDRIVSSFATPVIYSMDNLHANALYKIAKEFINESKKYNKDVYICAIAHPKFSSIECVCNMMNFIKKSKDVFGDQVDFITVREAYNKIFTSMTEKMNA